MAKHVEQVRVRRNRLRVPTEQALDVGFRVVRLQEEVTFTYFTALEEQHLYFSYYLQWPSAAGSTLRILDPQFIVKASVWAV